MVLGRLRGKEVGRVGLGSGKGKAPIPVAVSAQAARSSQEAFFCRPKAIYFILRQALAWHEFLPAESNPGG
jgi:hypothetical protein